MLFRFKRRTASVPLPWCARQAPQVSDRSDCESSCTSALTAERRRGQIMYNIENTAARIKNLRIKHGITQEAFADKLGVTLRFLQRAEAGSRAFSVDLLAEIAEIFDVSLDFLVLGRYTTKDLSHVKASLNEIALLLQNLEEQL